MPSLNRKNLWGGVFLILLFLFPLISSGGVPNMFSYQGRLYDADGNLLGGDGTTYYFRFSIWDSSVGGTKLWPGSTPSTMAINVEYGVFNVNIGDVSAGGDFLSLDFADGPYYLQVSAASQLDFSDGETLLPRQQIVSSGYAINADTLDSYHASTTPGANEIPVLDSLGDLSIAGLINNAQISGGVLASGTLLGGTMTGGIISGGTLTGGFYSSTSITPEADLTINEDLIIQGQLAIGSFTSHPTSSLRQGALYFNSDDERFYFWTGELWQELAAGENGPSATATLQSAYDYSSTPAVINTSDNKDIVWNLANTNTDSNFIIDSRGNNAFLIQDNSNTIFSILPPGNLVFKPLISSNDSFQVQDPSGIPLLNIDTLSMEVRIGEGIGTSDPSLLVLDTKNTAGDPVCANGAMYYNSFLEKTRICENNIWKDFIQIACAKSFIALHAPSRLFILHNIGVNYIDFSPGSTQTTIIDFTGFKQARLVSRMSSQTASGKVCLRVYNITDDIQLGDEVCVTGSSIITATSLWADINFAGDKEIKLQIHDNMNWHDPRVGLVVLELR